MPVRRLQVPFHPGRCCDIGGCSATLQRQLAFHQEPAMIKPFTPSLFRSSTAARVSPRAPTALVRVRAVVSLCIGLATAGAVQATDPRTGAIVGGAVGAAGGAVIGQQAGGTTGAVVGAAVGAGLGAAIGASVSDRQHDHSNTVRYPQGSTVIVPAGSVHQGGHCPPGLRKDGCVPPEQGRDHGHGHGHGHKHGHGHRN